MIQAPPQPQILRLPQWNDVPQLVHGFFGRRGGQSRGTFAELNLSFRVGDDAETVGENWRRVSKMVGPNMRFATMTQVHGTRVITVGHQGANGAQADALATRETAIALSILTADCVPMLFVVPEHHVVAAAHAGWRGTVAGIAARTVQHLQGSFGVSTRNIRVALGPSIGGCCYQVGRNIVDRLEERWGAIPDAVRRDGAGNPGSAKAMLDLRRANAAILIRAGIRAADIASIGSCTRCAATEYFSYRAASAATGSGVTGRQLSFIGWQA